MPHWPGDAGAAKPGPEFRGTISQRSIPRKLAHDGPARHLGRVTTLRHIDALLGTTWVWDDEADEDGVSPQALAAEVDAMLDELAGDLVDG